MLLGNDRRPGTQVPCPATEVDGEAGQQRSTGHHGCHGRSEAVKLQARYVRRARRLGFTPSTRNHGRPLHARDLAADPRHDVNVGGWRPGSGGPPPTGGHVARAAKRPFCADRTSCPNSSQKRPFLKRGEWQLSPDGGYDASDRSSAGASMGSGHPPSARHRAWAAATRSARAPSAVTPSTSTRATSSPTRM